MTPGRKPFDIEGVVGGSSLISNGDTKMTLEFTGLRVINVENLGGNAAGSGPTDVRKVDLVSSFAGAVGDHLGSGAKTANQSSVERIGRPVRRNRSIRLLRAMVKIQVAAQARVGSNSFAFRHTLSMASCAISSSSRAARSLCAACAPSATSSTSSRWPA